MDFGDVIKAMKKNPEKKFARKGWNGKGIYIGLQNPDEHSANTLPYIYMVTDKLISDNPDAPRGRVPWLASQSDMLADDDWVEVAPTPFGLNRIDSGICSNIAKEFKECRYDNQPNPQSDLVHSPAHYTAGRKYEPWDVALDWDLDCPMSLALRYIARAGRKQYAGLTMKQSEETDIMKAIECLEKELSVIREKD